MGSNGVFSISVIAPFVVVGGQVRQFTRLTPQRTQFGNAPAQYVGLLRIVAGLHGLMQLADSARDGLCRLSVGGG